MKKQNLNNSNMPNFDELWLKIRDRIDYPKSYLLQNRSTGMWLAQKDGKSFQTIFPKLATAFHGKDGKAQANLFLYINQSDGMLLDFTVEEYQFRHEY